jgi:cell division protein FtsA
LKRGAVTGSTIPAKKMETVIGARMKDMFALINAHLKSIGRDRLLPAGIVITGGGAGLGATSDIARAALRIPAQIGLPTMSARISTLDATWAVALGLCRVGFAEDRVSRTHAIGDLLRQMIASVQRVFRSFLP